MVHDEEKKVAEIIKDFSAEIDRLQRENEELRKALGKLEREACEVSKLGAVPGRQWTLLAGALINARTALAGTGGEHHGN